MTHNDRLIRAILDYLSDGGEMEGNLSYPTLIRFLCQGGGVTDFLNVMADIHQLMARVDVEALS
jgi:hypothetical protein